ncbi:MAG: hypothetical protein COA63_008510 [Methylophaga sp.]|nr:hypothetical protein [Methylophaga sp.]
MKNVLNQRHWLYLLTALLLLMQSFAIWHDVSHPFHITSDQCQRFESVSHTPTLDLAISIKPQFTVQFSTTEPTLVFTSISIRQREHHAIRAPPVFS